MVLLPHQRQQVARHGWLKVFQLLEALLSTAADDALHGPRVGAGHGVQRRGPQRVSLSEHGLNAGVILLGVVHGESLA